MKYFAKYLSVEGESIHPKFVISGGLRDIGEIGGKGLQYHEQESLKKLYLCSRDVQIGDTVKLLYGSNNDYDIKFEDELNSAEWYKVIGEISPNAIWVNEGMEFDEDQVIITSEKRVNNIEDCEDWTDIKYDYFNLVKIKCPICKTFH